MLASPLNCPRMVYRNMETEKEGGIRTGPKLRSPSAYLSGGDAGLNDAMTACVIYTVPMYTIPFSFNRNLKCLGSNMLIPFPQPTNSSCCFQREGGRPWERGMNVFTVILTGIQHLD